MKRLRNASIALIGLLLFIAARGLSQTTVEIEPVTKPVRTNTLGTCRYKPSAAEAPFYEKLSEMERRTGSLLEDYSIHHKAGYVSWYGIVRGVSRTESGPWRLLLEHKFFDGMTDCHIMLVDIAGSGDFLADIDVPYLTVPPLALVRIYGTIQGTADGMPILSAAFARVWPWLTFTLTDLSPKDRTNPRWMKLRTRGRGSIYEPWPDEGYYRALLGDPSLVQVR